MWEELDAQHFFTKQVQRRALAEGAQFARDFNDTGAATYYQAQADALSVQLQGYWSEAQGRVNAYRVRGRSGVDCAVLLGANHGWNQSSVAASLDESQFGPATQRILATLKVYTDAFRTLYPINRGAAAPAPVLVGRYPEVRGQLAGVWRQGAGHSTDVACGLRGARGRTSTRGSSARAATRGTCARLLLPRRCTMRRAFWARRARWL